ncbi:DUF5683 domain-containing protein [Microscilla marina]|nr:DUF5683 domain-containing protein [Microscilla marina]
MIKLLIRSVMIVGLFAGIANAQIDFQQLNPVLQKDSNRIMIGYSIVETNAKLGDYLATYNIQLTYTQDGGATFIGPLTQVKGDVGNELIAGKDQKIYWYYLAEGNGFDGQNVEFKVDASYEPFLGGPINALRSALLPGWGNVYVKKPRKKWKWRWILTAAGTYGLIAGSLYLKQLSNNNYQKYLEATTLSETQDLYKRANRQNLLATTAAVLAAGLWAYDIVKVAIRGGHNKRRKKRIIRRNLQRRQQKVISLGYNPVLNSSSIGFLWKF